MYIPPRKRKSVSPFPSSLPYSFLLFSLHFPLDFNCQSNCKRKKPNHPGDPNSGPSASSTPPQGGGYEGGDEQLKGNNYEVFLSFRGKDTRKGFTDYLYTSLVDAGIHVFRDDDELCAGEDIGPELIRSITQSKVSIPIISEDYASSKWCLRELVQMLKCKRNGGQTVLPIFYKVKPSQLRNPTGRLRDAINAHKKNLDKLVAKEWAEALEEVSFLKGWESEKVDNGHEGALVKAVVRKVMGELKRLFQLNVPEQLVGIDDHVEQVMSKIDDTFNGTRIIGIYGMGGIGKTTLAKVIYNKLSCHFEDHSFVANIRETSQRDGIKCLQKQLISGIIGSACDVTNIDEGVNVIKSRFTSKKVLILLDDIDDSTHLNALVGDGSWFKAGSIVIITTRNKSILNEARVGCMYQLNELSLDQSLILFSRHAFRKDSPPSTYEVISRDVVSTTGGLPLALEVIGSFLCGKTKEAWKDTSLKLKKAPHKKVQETLRISYNALDSEDQQIFLDIACFFSGSYKGYPTYMWDACGFFPRKGIEVLSLMSLIKVDEHGNLIMHDQLRDFGREIVRLENPKEPQERSRLWIYEEVLDVLDGNKGTGKMEALSLGKCGTGRTYTAEQFKEMTNLRFLQVDGTNFTGDFQSLLPRLRWLQWVGCPSDFTAANFHLKKLVILDLLHNAITEDWGGWIPLKMATELKVLNLTGCQSLRRTPDLSAFKSLEILVLRYCENLEEIHPSIENVKTLVSFDVHGCTRLKELPEGIGRMLELRELLINDTDIQEIPISRGGLMKLETLRVSNCKQLSQLPEAMGSLVSLTLLELSDLEIEELPETIGSLKKLKTLDASNCKQLALLPESMGYLVSLTLMNLSGSVIEELPKSIESMKELKTLDARECASLARIPSSIGDLASLQRLLLDDCSSLTEIPDSIGKLASLTELGLASTLIAELPESIGNLQNLRILEISATKITELPDAIVKLAKLQKLGARGCANLERLPSNIGELVSLEKLLLDNSGISGLPESISKLSSLQKLSLGSCKKLRELPNMPSGLRALNITCQSPPLPHLPELTRLKKLAFNEIHWLEYLPELPLGLTKLSIIRCGKLKALTNLSNLKHLSYLRLHKCFDLAEATALEGSHCQSNLHAWHCPEVSRINGIEDSSKLINPEVPHLDRLLYPFNSKILQGTNAASWMDSVEIPGLSGPKPSQISGIFKCRSAVQLIDFSSLKYLSILSVTNCKNITEIRGLDGSESLRYLYIEECPSLRQLPDLSNSKNLRVFCARNCENLVEIQGLDGLESLIRLEFIGCTSLRQLLDLSNLKNLEIFTAKNCQNLVEIRGLDGLESLKHLNISGCTSVIKAVKFKECGQFQCSNYQNPV